NENYSRLLNDGDPVEDPIYDVLKKRQDRFRAVREILLDAHETSFIFVLNPERLPVAETEKALSLLDQYHLHVETLIVNKVLPENADGEFLMERKKHERQYINSIEDKFNKQQLIYIPMFSRDIINEQHLEKFSNYIF